MFRPFSVDHLLVLLLGFACITLLVLVARRKTPEQQQLWGAILGYTIAVTYLVVFISIDSARNGFDPRKHLPFALCNMCGITVWLVLHKKSYLAYEILFFWIMSGTLAACIMPEIKQAIPHYTFFAFWIIHLGLVGAAIYATLVYGMRPTFKSLIKAFVALNIYAIFVGVINWLLSDFHTNYFYVCHKPDVWTPLNWFGDWPWYIFWGQWFAAGVFLVIYLPFLILDMIRGKV